MATTLDVSRPLRQHSHLLFRQRRATFAVVKSAFEAAGIEFIDPTDGGAGLRLKANERSNRK
jgi:hypothetical protein